jgi:hypothetical protein
MMTCPVNVYDFVLLTCMEKERPFVVITVCSFFPNWVVIDITILADDVKFPTTAAIQ